MFNRRLSIPVIRPLAQYCPMTQLHAYIFYLEQIADYLGSINKDYSPTMGPIALCTIFTIILILWNSEQKNGLLIKLFCFSSDFVETWWSCSTHCVLQFHTVSSKSDEKQKSFTNCPFFCSKFQSVSRIMKIIHRSTKVNVWLLQLCLEMSEIKF